MQKRQAANLECHSADISQQRFYTANRYIACATIDTSLRQTLQRVEPQ